MQLTPEEAFEAMTLFLKLYYEYTESDDVGSLLGGMMIDADGGTFDPAYWHEWMRCIQQVKDEAESE